jgi:hypothetical protein
MSMNCTLYAAPLAQVQQLAGDADAFIPRLAVRANGGRSLPLRKTWHGLHFALTGTAWEGNDPLCFLLSGGEAVGPEADEDEAYSPPRVLSPAFVRKLAKALTAITDADFSARLDVGRLAEAGVYPRIWDEPAAELHREYRAAFTSVRRFVSEAAARGDAVVVEIS